VQIDELGESTIEAGELIKRVRGARASPVLRRPLRLKGQ